MFQKTSVAIALSFLLTIGAFGQSLSQNEIDEFSGERVVVAEHVLIEHEGFSGRANIFPAYTGNRYLLILTVMSRDSWQILSADNAQFIIDEDRNRFSLLRIDTDINRGNVVEQYGMEFNQQEFEKIANASDVRFRINGNVYTVNQEAKDSVQLVIDTVNEQ